nr:MAG TPA: hypothetical protein [Caudoviricetes sp.]DAU54016.1 MAG TPA: hypothetical protein [Caudoviricetes sp.]
MDRKKKRRAATACCSPRPRGGRMRPSPYCV